MLEKKVAVIEGKISTETERALKYKKNKNDQGLCPADAATENG